MNRTGLRGSSIALSVLLGNACSWHGVEPASLSSERVRTPTYVSATTGEQAAVDEQLGHATAVTCLRFSHDGRLVVSGARDGALFLWRTDGLRLLRRLDAHVAPITACSFVGSNVVAAADQGGSLHMWDVTSGRALPVADELITAIGAGTSHGISRLAADPRGAVVLVGRTDGLVTLWDAAKQRAVGNATAAKEGLHDIGFDDRGRAFIVRTASLSIWSAENNAFRVHAFKAKRSLAEGSSDGYTVAAVGQVGGGFVLVGADGSAHIGGATTSTYPRVALGESTVAAARDRRTIEIWAEEGARFVCSTRASSAVTMLALEPSHRGRVIAGTADGTILAMDGATCAVLASHHAQLVGVDALAVGARQLAVGTSDGRVGFWYPYDWTQAVSYRVGRSRVQGITSVGDGRFAALTRDGDVIDFPHAQPPVHLGRLTGVPVGIARVAERNRFVTFERSAGRLQVWGWDTRARAYRDEDTVSFDGASMLALSPDGRSFLAGREGDNAFVRGQLGSSNPLEEDVGWRGEALTVLAYANDDKHILKGLRDGGIEFDQNRYDPTRKDGYAILRGLTSPIAGVVADGVRAWAGDISGAVAHWERRYASRWLWKQQLDGAVTAIARISDTNDLIVGLGTGEVVVLDATTGDRKAKLFPLRNGQWASVAAGEIRASPRAADTLRFRVAGHEGLMTARELGGGRNTGCHISDTVVTRISRNTVDVVFSATPTPDSVTLDGARLRSDGHRFRSIIRDTFGVEHRIVARVGAATCGKTFIAMPDADVAKAFGVYRVLSIGASKYVHDELPGARVDALNVLNAFGAKTSWGVAGGRALHLENPGEKQLKDDVSKFLLSARSNDVLLVYFAGHADVQGGDAFLRSTDHTPASPKGMGAEELGRLLAFSPARSVVVIIDACRAGDFAAFATIMAQKTRRASRYRAIVAAARPGATAEERTSGGVFTQAFLDAIDGVDKIVLDSRGVVTLGSAVTYAALVLKTQKPQRFGDEDLDLLPLSSTGAGGLAGQAVAHVNEPRVSLELKTNRQVIARMLEGPSAAGTTMVLSVTLDAPADYLRMDVEPLRRQGTWVTNVLMFNDREDGTIYRWPKSRMIAGLEVNLPMALVPGPYKLLVSPCVVQGGRDDCSGTYAVPFDQPR